MIDDRMPRAEVRASERPAAGRYDLIQRADLEKLAEVRSGDTPMFSLYLDLRPDRRELEQPQIRFKNLLRQAEQRIGLEQQPRTYRKQWAEEADRLRTWLDDERQHPGRGWAVLSCQSITPRIWRVYRLPVPVRDRLEVADRLYLRPLATLLDEFECYLAVLIGAETTRIMEIRLGMAEELTELRDHRPPATGRGAENINHRRDTYLHRHAIAVAERVEALWRERNCDWLVIGGTEEELGELRAQLSKPLRERLAGELHLAPQAEPSHVLERVLEIEREHERQVEAQRVEEVITLAHKGGAGVLGLEATLLAITEERVMMLIVEEDFTHAGWECPNCHFLGAVQQSSCPLCGSTLNPQPDIVEVALERVFDQDGDLEVLRSQESRQALTPYGRIGALLRY